MLYWSKYRMGKSFLTGKLHAFWGTRARRVRLGGLCVAALSTFHGNVLS